MSNDLLRNQPIETLKKAVSIKQQIDVLERRLASLFGSSADPAKGRKVSPGARRRIAEAQKARWAKYRSQRVAADRSPKKTRRKVSAAVRARLSQLAKRRWAAAKKAGKSKL